MDDDADLSTLASRCRFRREQLEISQERLAALAGYSSQSGIAGIEEGRVRRPTNILGLAAALGVRPDWLLTGEGPMIEAGRPRDPIPAPDVPPPSSFSRLNGRPGYQLIELKREMPTNFVIRLMDLLVELDRLEAEQRAAEDREN